MNFFVDRKREFISTIGVNASDILYDRICSYFLVNFFNIKEALDNYDKDYISINKIYCDFGTHLIEYYPEVARKFDAFLKNQVIWINEIKAAIETIDHSHSIKEVKLFKGDLHNGNRSTSAVILNNGNRVYVKPKSIGAEASFYTLLENIFPNQPVSVPGFTIRSFETIEMMGDASQRRSGRFNRSNYYNQLGLSASLFWLLSTGDVFDENIICQNMQSKPGFVDLECLYGPSFFSKKDCRDPFVKSHFRFENSLARSAMLDVELDQKYAQGPLTTSSLIHRNYLSIPSVRNKGGKYKYIKISQSDFSSFVNGFEYGLQQLQKIDKNMIHEALQQCDARFLFRNTRSYSALITEICKPEYYLSSKLIDRTEENYLSLNGDKDILEYEFRNVRNLDIPVFKIKWNSLDVYDINSNLLAKSVFGMSPSELFETKFDILKSHNGIKSEIGLLRGCFNLKFDKRTFLRSFSSNNKPLSNLPYSKIESYLFERVYKIYDDLQFFEYLSTTDFKGYHVSQTTSDIYRGTTGMAISLLDLVKIDAEKKRMADIEETLYVQNLKLSCYVLDKKLDVDEFSFFSIPTASIFHHLLRCRALNLDIDFELLSRYLDWCLKKIKKDEYGDILIGFAGIALFLSNNISLFGELTGKVENVIQDYLSRVLKKYSFLSNKFNYEIYKADDNSFSHGMSGFLYVFNSLIVNGHGSSRLIDIADALCENLLKTYSKELTNWYIDSTKNHVCDSGVNHGNAGILLALVSIYQRNPFAIDYSYIKETVNNIISNSENKEISIGNGSLGDILVLSGLLKKNCLRSKEERIIKQFIEKMDSTLFYDQIRRKCHFLSPGLFTGFSGIIHVHNVLLNRNSFDLFSFKIF